MREKITKILNVGVETVVEGVDIKFTYQVTNNELPVMVGFNYNDGGAIVNGNISNDGNIYTSTNGGAIPNSNVMTAVVAKAKTFFVPENLL